jgi:trigger factor
MQTTAVQTTTERLEGDRVRLRVEVPESLLSPSIDAVYRRWANEIKVPGFRKGKVPRTLIDARVGPGAVRDEAVRDALPDLYRQALDAEDLHAVAPPDIEVVTFEEGSPLVFEATIDVRPDIELPDLGSIMVDAPPAEVTDEDVNEQLERLRERFAELESVAREARRGDYVLIDLKGYRHDQPVEGASAPDLLYEVGSGTGPPRLDDELEGVRPGAILKFNDTVAVGEDPQTEPEGIAPGAEGGGPTAPGGAVEISFTVLVKEVKTKKLPALDDDFAKTVGELDTLDQLKEDLKERLAGVKAAVVEEQIRGHALQELVARTDLTAPEVLVEAEFEHRLGHFEDQLKRAGATLAEYAHSAQVTELEIRRDIREEATKAVKADLLLEEIARRQEIDVTEEDVGREIAVLAARTGKEPKEVAQMLADSGRLGALAADIMRGKALDYLVQSVNVVGRETEES